MGWHEPCVLRLVSIVDSVLEKVERHGERCQFLVQTQLPEPEEIFSNLVGEISGRELLAPIVESTGTIGPGIEIQRRALNKC